MRLKLNGVNFQVAEVGNPEGIPLVFIHGFPFDQTMWEPQLKALPHSFRAFTYDLRGHGKSEMGDGQYTVELFVDDLMALLDYFQIAKAILCGLSLGGYIALRAAERNGDRIRSLLLCGTKSEADPNETKLKRAEQIKLVKSDGARALAPLLVKSLFAPTTHEENPAVVEKIRRTIESTDPLALAGTLLAMASRTDTTASLAKIQVPTLILVGEADTITPPSPSRAMHEKIAGSKMAVIPKAGHLSNLENPEEFNRHFLEFLKGA